MSDTTTSNSPEWHRARHVELHRNLDELVADFIGHTTGSLGRTTLLAFMEWSHQQTLEPTQ